MKKIQDIKFVDKINVWILRKINKYIKKYENKEIDEIDLIAETFNYYIVEEDKFKNEEEANIFFDNLEIEDLEYLGNKLKEIQENTNIAKKN